MADQFVGLIVLPTHPLRVAWQQGFDLLAMHHRYAKGLPGARVAKLLEGLPNVHMPAFLPGIGSDETLVFADTLGFHAVAMVVANDPEPKATVALLARLLGSEDTVAPTVGRGASTLLSEEIGRYLDLHPETRRVKVHAIRAGDGLTVARALGLALKSAEPPDDYVELIEHEVRPALAYVLDLHGAGVRADWSGRFLSTTAEKRRVGAGGVPEEDRWLLESVTRPGGVSIPRLQWARRRSPFPTEAAHLAVIFDVFPTSIEVRPVGQFDERGTLEVHGLSLSPSRHFDATGTPKWEVYVPPEFDGEKHPVARVLTERLVRAHAAIQRATARHLGGAPDGWPVMITRVSPELAEVFGDLHRQCDWVITADHNAGVEYFDSPTALPKEYEAYLIDCVPERDDLGFLQLITSTACLDEVVQLFDVALAEMGLSASPRIVGFYWIR